MSDYKNMNAKDDDIVISRIIDGDVNAFESLMKKYSAYVLTILKRHLPREQVEETAQDVFFSAYQSLSSYKRECRFKQWLSSIAVKTCYQYWRKKYKLKELTMSSLTTRQLGWLETVTSEQAVQSFNDLGKKKEAREVLDWALGAMAPEDKIILELVYLEGQSGKEAAKLLGWSVANVKIRLYRARKKLYKLLTHAAS